MKESDKRDGDRRLWLADLLDVGVLPTMSPPSAPWKILVVDDDVEVHSVTNLVLADFRFDGRALDLLHAYSGREAIEVFTDHPDIAVALLDVMMESNDAGLHVVEHVRNVLNNHAVRLILRTGQPGMAPEADVVARYDINDYKAKTELSALKLGTALTTALRAYRDFTGLEHERVAVEQVRDAALLAMASLASSRDNEGVNHIVRVQHYVRLLAGQLGDNPRFPMMSDACYVDVLVKSVPLHDIGKIGIPDRVLLKTEPLTVEEFEIMKRHTTIGRDALLAAERRIGGESPFLAVAREIAGGHHEKWDGSGYPGGLTGENIPVAARLMALADAYDMATARRVYSLPVEHADAVEAIRKGSGRDFDPDVVAAFLLVAGDFMEVAEGYSDAMVEIGSVGSRQYG